MKARTFTLVALLVPLGMTTYVKADILGSAGDYGVLAGTTVTNTGLTVVTGNVGVWPGTAITGFPPGVVVDGDLQAGNSAAQQAQADVVFAYDSLEGMTPTTDLTGQDLGGLTLTPGVYSFSSSAFLTGNLTLDGQGDPNAMFVFQMGSTLITASDSEVFTINGAEACDVYWQVGSSATLGTGTAFQGNILALTSITLTTGATLLDGSALAINGAVTMDTNLITAACIPEPNTSLLFGSAGIGMMCIRRRRQASSK